VTRRRIIPAASNKSRRGTNPRWWIKSVGKVGKDRQIFPPASDLLGRFPPSGLALERRDRTTRYSFATLTYSYKCIFYGSVIRRQHAKPAVETFEEPPLWAAETIGGSTVEAKIFCFFFSKKKYFFPA
jgi:hypothetical protein